MIEVFQAQLVLMVAPVPVAIKEIWDTQAHQELKAHKVLVVCVDKLVLLAHLDLAEMMVNQAALDKLVPWV